MPTAPSWGYRIKNVLLALVVFCAMIILPAAMSGCVLGVIESVALHMGGYEALAEVYEFLIDNMNLFSALVYAFFGLPVFIWVLVMRRRGRLAAQAVQATAALPGASAVPQPEQVSFRVRGVPRSAWVDSTFLALGLQFLTTLVMVLILVTLPAAMEEYESLVEGSGITQYGVMWFVSTVVLPPLVEETGFRGLGLTYLRRAGIPFAVANVLQAVAFGIFHMNLTQGIYTFVLGLFMGYVAHRTGSVVPAMLLHAVYNLMGTLGTDLLYTFVPWLPFWFEVAIGLVLTVPTMLSLRDRGGLSVARG